MNVVWWKEFFPNQKQSTKNEIPEEDETIFKAAGLNTGLNTGLKPAFGLKTQNHVSDSIEGLLTAVEINLIKEAFRRRRFERLNRKTREI